MRVARLGSFSGAARELDLAPSVITKRVGQLEKSLATRLIQRSTRGLALTAAGERILPQFVRLTAELDEIFKDTASDGTEIEGHLRIKTPTTITSERLGPAFADFAAAHPGVTVELIFMDRSVNPLEEGYDIALGALPVTYPHTLDIPLFPYELVACCSPAYLKGRDELRHPTDLAEHECLTTTLMRNTWLFESTQGHLSVDVHSRMHACDSRVLREAARRGLGIAALPRFLAEEDLRSGALVAVLREYPIVEHWLKAYVPRMKMNRPAVRECIAFLKSNLEVMPADELQQARARRA